MTDYPPAFLAFVTQPRAGVWILNVQETQDTPVLRWRISLDHLSNIVADGARMAFTVRKTT